MDNEDATWVDYRKRFAELYDSSNYESPLQSFVMRASHKLAENSYGSDACFNRVLEIGAGTGEHVGFVKHQFSEYVLTDHDGGPLNIAKTKLVGRHEGKLKFEVQSGDTLSYAENSFDRVIATHVLEHIYQPHLALKEWKRVIKNGGILTVLIPTDPGLAWRLGRHLGPRKNAIKQGIAYDFIMAREHVNPCNNLIAIMRHYFPSAREAWWPLPIASMDLNLFFVFHATVIK